jgi:hypothetical protein
MMMKSKLVSPEEQKQEIKFPCLAIYHSKYGEHQNFVVLFSTSNSGTVVQADDQAPYKLGHYMETWTGAENRIWKIVPPGTKIELTQE